jgi:hypothetical protein
MNNLKTYLVVLLFAVMNSAKGQFIFTRTYGQSSINEGTGVVAAFDGGYIVCGHTSTNNSDYYILKLADDGVLQWFKTYGELNIEHASGMITTPDSCYLIVGYTNSNTATGDYDISVMKIDQQGQRRWSKMLGGTDWDFGRSITNDGNGNYIIAGSTYNGMSNTLDAIVMKVDSGGNLIWQKIFNTPSDDELYSVCLTDNGEFIAAGNTNDGFSGSKDVIAIKFDAAGDSVFYKQYGSELDEDAFNIINQSGRYMISGSNSDSQGLNNFSIRINDAGDSLNSVVLANSADEITTSVDHNGINYWITGYTSSFGGGKKDAFISKVDSLGNNIIGTTFGGAENEIANAIMATTDGGAIAVGSSSSYGPGTQSLYIIKIDSALHSGSLIIGIDEKGASVTQRLYFDERSQSIFIESKNPLEKAKFSLIDLSGRNFTFDAEKDGSKMKIRTRNLAEGLYIFSYESDGKKYSLKFAIR